MSLRTHQWEGGFAFNDESLARHGVSRIEAIQVIESEQSAYFELPPGAGFCRIMFVGFSYAGVRLLEVGVELLSDDRDLVFHASKASSHFRRLYRQQRRI